MSTLNDVIDYSKFYSGKDEPPFFYHEYFELKNKLFVPSDDFKLAQKLTDNVKENVVLHYFEHDTKQNKLLANNFADVKLHSKVFAVASPDFSADGGSCWSCLNEANILKSRICAFRWQQECGEPVILTLLWSGRSSYKYAFDNVEIGTVCAVSHQGVKDEKIFREGLETAIDRIKMEQLCWLGNIPDYVKEFYDFERIIKMQTRTELLHLLEKRNAEEKQLRLAI